MNYNKPFSSSPFLSFYLYVANYQFSYNFLVRIWL
nr:MAG TPA: hypothetical protein [Caudoviricetes sp.]